MIRSILNRTFCQFWALKILFVWFIGSLNKSPSEERVKSHSSVPSLAVCVKIKEKTTKKLSRNQKTSEGCSNSRTMPLPEGEKKVNVARAKKIKKKYFCFMPC